MMVSEVHRTVCQQRPKRDNIPLLRFQNNISLLRLITRRDSWLTISSTSHCHNWWIAQHATSCVHTSDCNGFCRQRKAKLMGSAGRLRSIQAAFFNRHEFRVPVDSWEYNRLHHPVIHWIPQTTPQDNPLERLQKLTRYVRTKMKLDMSSDDMHWAPWSTKLCQ